MYGKLGVKCWICKGDVPVVKKEMQAPVAAPIPV
jgi:ribosomal protein S3